MKNLKKIIAAMLVCVLALTVLTGCGKSAKQYGSEVAGKLGASSGVAVDEATQKTAETIIKEIKKLGPFQLIDMAKDPKTAEAKVNEIYKKAGITDNMKFAVSVSAPAVKLNVGFNGDQNTTSAAADFFANEIKTYNGKNDKKLTKIGFATYDVPFVTVVIMVAQ